MIKLKNLLEDIKVTDKDSDTMGVDILDPSKKKVGHFDLETYDGTYWTIIGANINPEHQRKGYYHTAILQLLDQYPTITIVSAFRSAEADKAWASLKNKVGNKYNLRTKKEDGELVHYLSKK
jgi:hypothetical protein